MWLLGFLVFGFLVFGVLVSWFLGWFLGFLASWCQSFVVSKCLEFLVSKCLCFKVYLILACLLFRCFGVALLLFQSLEVLKVSKRKKLSNDFGESMDAFLYKFHLIFLKEIAPILPSSHFYD